MPIQRKENDSINRLFELTLRFGSGKNIGANGTYDIYRPNYADPATGSVLIASRQPMRIEPGPGMYPEPKAPGVEKYSIFCDRRLVRVGDLLIPNPVNNISQTAVTVMNTDENKEMSGFRSNHIGQLTHARNKVDFTNVRFDYFGLPTSEEAIFPDLDGAQKYRRARVALWWRNGLITGMRLIETPIINNSPDNQLIWNIVGIAGNFPVAELELVTGRGG